MNNWVWEGEPEADNRRMSESFHREMDKLAGRHIDVAFMLIDPRQEKDFYLGMDDFMRMVGADVVFPMHFWEAVSYTHLDVYKRQILYHHPSHQTERGGPSLHREKNVWGQ